MSDSLPSSSVTEAYTPESSEETASDIVVYVSGEVQRPGLYHVPALSRVGDAVTHAGGLTDEADLAAINLASALDDGVHVHIPGVGESLPASGGAGGATSTTAAKVHLNSADAAQLETLPGIGPSLAQSILDWRNEHGKFAAVEDLLSVSGIGSATFDKLKDKVDV
ncbi:ComEA family DNA-binding protein [Arcanobacterium haemolyticum]|nr:ComEA family DNA-binding protein [Arcanobacterium haemolyticum]